MTLTYSMSKRGIFLREKLVVSRLTQRLILPRITLHNGESMHSFRSGCSITLSSLGVSYAEVAAHMGWKSCEMAAYYCQFEKVMAHDGTSSRLSQAAGQSSVSNISVAERLGQDFRDRNNLTGCVKFFD